VNFSRKRSKTLGNGNSKIQNGLRGISNVRRRVTWELSCRLKFRSYLEDESSPLLPEVKQSLTILN